MKYQTILALFVLLLISACQPTYDIVILNGRVIDPETNTDAVLNVGINGDKVVKLTRWPISGKETIRANGLVVSPGFIDVNSVGPNNEVVEKYKVMDGVTTMVFGHDGVTNTEAYFATQAKLNHRINYAAMVTSPYVRYQWKEQRFVALKKNLDDGAIGITNTIEYHHESYADLLKYALFSKQHKVPLFLHLRHSSKQEELSAVDEAIQLAFDSGAQIQITHIHSTGGTYHPEQALAKLARAIAMGADITSSIYPYTYWTTDIRSGRFDDLKEKYGLEYTDLIIAGSSEHLSVQKYEQLKHQKIYVAVPEGTIPYKSLALAYKQPFVMISSIGAIAEDPHFNFHPRGAGAFARAFEVGRKIGLDTPTIVKKTTLDPANVFASVSQEFALRGRLNPGSIADITIFDPERISSPATLENPNQVSKGIEWVLVNGQVVVKNGRLQDVYPGRAIKR